MKTPPLDNIQSLAYFTPELVLCGAVLLVISWDLLAKGRAKLPGIIAISAAALAYSAGMSVYVLSQDMAPQNLFYGLLAFDRFSNLFRIVFAFVSAAIIIFSTPKKG